MTTVATPGDARRQRIRLLTSLIRRASSELETLLAAEQRGLKLVPPGLPTGGDEPPLSNAPGSIIRKWALDTGLVDAGGRGRISNDLRAAYAEAGEPYGR